MRINFTSSAIMKKRPLPKFPKQVLLEIERLMKMRNILGLLIISFLGCSQPQNIKRATSSISGEVCLCINKHETLEKTASKDNSRAILMNCMEQLSTSDTELLDDTIGITPSKENLNDYLTFLSPDLHKNCDGFIKLLEILISEKDTLLHLDKDERRNCWEYWNGKYRYLNPSLPGNTLEITQDTLIEYSQNSEFKTVSSISWIDSCSYSSEIILNTNPNFQIVGYPGNKFIYTILEIKGSEFLLQAKNKGIIRYIKVEKL